MTKQQLLDKFERTFRKKFGKNAIYEYEKDDDERISVSVPLDVMDWGEIEPAVEKLLKSTGLSRYFEVGGAGTGFGFRDVSIYRKGT